LQYYVECRQEEVNHPGRISGDNKNLSYTVCNIHKGADGI
jgi:hypothetical protein